MNVDVTFLYIVVIFFLVAGILKRFLFSPLMAILDEREGDAKAAAQAHAESLTALSGAMAQAEEKLSLARREALKVREGLRGEGVGRLEKKLEEALAFAEASVAEAARQIDAQVAASSRVLPEQARGLAAGLAEKILGRKLAS